MTFTANGKQQKWNFCRLSSALCAVESKYLFAVNSKRHFLILYDLYKITRKEIENQSWPLPFAVCLKRHLY